MNKTFKPLSVFLISCLGFLIYSNTFFSSFHFDDFTSIVDNVDIRNIHHLQSIWNFLPRRFILYLSIALNYHFNGLNVFGYHLFNLTIHLLTAVLVWWLMFLTLSTPVMRNEKMARYSPILALLAGLVFVSHPLQTEAVTYIVQRAASMATLFYLASLCFYVKSRLGSFARIYYSLSLIAAIMAMFTKEISITLPLMILFYEFSFLRVNRNFNWKSIIPVSLTIFIIPLIMLLTESSGARVQQLSSEPGISSIHYLLTEFRVMLTYMRLLFVPLGQNMDYDYPISTSFLTWASLLSLLSIITILILAKRLFLKYRLVSFFIFWFFLTLLPESSIFPIKDVIFEHRLYLPMVGYSIFLVSALYYLLGKNNSKAWIVVLSMVIACNSLLTFQRNKVWKDDFTLWNDTVLKSPHKARPYSNRGNAQGNLKQAMSDFSLAIALDPNYTDAYYNRGVIYGREGNFIQAMSDYNKAIELSPNDVKAYYNRGVILGQQGHLAQALADYNKVINLSPNDAQAYTNRGTIFVQEGKIAQAMSDFTKAIETGADDLQAYVDRGTIYAQRGNFMQAMADFSKAIEIDPYYAGAYDDRAVFYFQLKQYDKAWADLRHAQGLGAKVNPRFINALRTASGREQ